MFGPSVKFALTKVSQRKILRSTCSIFPESSKYFSIEKQRFTGEINDSLTERCNSSKLSEGLSHHFHRGEIPIVESTVGKLFEEAANKWPNRECIVSRHQGLSFTFAQLHRRVDKLSAGLLKLGLKHGDRVGLWGPNDIEWFISTLAISRVGLIMVGINPAYQQSEIDYCLEKVGARAVIAPRTYKTQNYADMLIRSKEKCPSLQHIVIYSDDCVTGTRRFAEVESLANNIEVQAIAAMQNEISSFDGCNIQFTSGTTGRPKATLLSHRSFVNNSRQGAERLGLVNGHHKICLNVPFFHAYGMVMGQFASLHSGATIILGSQSYDPVRSVEAIIKEKCTVAYGTPTMWINLLDARERLQAPVDTLRCGVTGGATVSPEIMKRIREQLRFNEMQNIYGLTETTAIAFQSMPGDSNELTDNTVGYLSDHVEAMVVDDEGNLLPVGKPGELWIRGYSTMMKYWDDEPNTKKTITEDGWLKTGDQFVLQSNGYGQVVGRLKDVIIRGGENIFPKEIEHFLETHPDVREAHAFAVHDDVYGDEICACVRLSENSKLTKNELRSFGRGRIAHFKIPRYIEFVDNYPRTSSGKIQKFQMRKELEERGVVPKRPKKN